MLKTDFKFRLNYQRHGFLNQHIAENENLFESLAASIEKPKESLLIRHEFKENFQLSIGSWQGKKTPQLGWNCFDIAVRLADVLGIEEADVEIRAKVARGRVVDYALTYSHEKEYRRLLAPEIRHAAALTAVYLNNPEGTDHLSGLNLQILPSSMHSPELRTLLHHYENAHKNEEMCNILEICNNRLGFPEGKRLSLDQLNDFFNKDNNASDYPEIYDMFIRNYYEHFKPHADALEEYCQREDVYRQYIQDYYGNQGWFAFQREFLGERSTSMVDIVSRMLNAQIVIQDQNNKEIYQTHPYGQQKIVVQYDGYGHFIAARQKANKLLAQNETYGKPLIFSQALLPGQDEEETKEFEGELNGQYCLRSLSPLRQMK